ncbi:hypothetical protein B9Z55_023439 [Caenorhabditis nigoni]|uniref:Uncharacterized protein n=1 Tax=Caenorhabditis nigoni TaxID=1611254 RepID=A0A2G5SQC1_9PELO|nr:hypothetical protein B9Z55_023439 [Caenorhabditis nigoni]
MDSELPEKEGSANSTQTDDVTKTDLLPTLADSGASDPANPEEISVQTVSEQTEKAEPTVGTSSVNDQESEESLLQKELKQVMKTTESEAAAGVLESQDSVDEDMDKIISKETEVLEPTVHGETTPTSDPGSPKGGSLEPRSEGSISPESQSVVHKDHSKKLLDETKETMEDQDVVEEVVDEEQRVLNEAALLNPIGPFLESGKILEPVEQPIGDNVIEKNLEEIMAPKETKDQVAVAENPDKTEVIGTEKSEESLFQKEHKQIMEKAEPEAAVGVLEPQNSVDEDIDKIISKETEVLEPTANDEITSKSDSGSPTGGPLEAVEPRSEGSISPASQSMVHREQAVSAVSNEVDQNTSETIGAKNGSEPTEKILGAHEQAMKTEDQEGFELQKKSDIASQKHVVEEQKLPDPVSFEDFEKMLETGAKEKNLEEVIEPTETEDQASVVEIPDKTENSEAEKSVGEDLELGDQFSVKDGESLESGKKFAKKNLGELMESAETQDQVAVQVPDKTEAIEMEKSVGEGHEVRDQVSMEDLLEEIGKSEESVKPEESLAEKIADGTNMPEEAKDEHMEIDNQVLDHLASEVNNHEANLAIPEKLQEEDNHFTGEDHKIVDSTASDEVEKIVPPPVIGFADAPDRNIKDGGSIVEKMDTQHEEKNDAPIETVGTKPDSPGSELSSADNEPIQLNTVDGINQDVKQDSPPARERSESPTSSDQSSSSPDAQLDKDADSNASVKSHDSEILEENVPIIKQREDATVERSEEARVHELMEPNSDHEEQEQEEEQEIGTSSIPPANDSEPPPISSESNSPIYNESFQIFGQNDTADGINEDVKQSSLPVKDLNEAVKDQGSFEPSDQSESSSPVNNPSEDSDMTRSPEEMDKSVGEEQLVSHSSMDQSVPANADLKEDADVNLPANSEDTPTVEEHIPIMEQCDDALVEEFQEPSKKGTEEPIDLVEPSLTHGAQVQKEEQEIRTSSISSANSAEPSPTLCESKLPLDNEPVQMNAADGIKEDVKKDSLPALNDAVKAPIPSETSSPVDDQSEDSDATRNPEDMDMAVEGERLDSPCLLDPTQPETNDLKTDVVLDAPAGSLDSENADKQEILEGAEISEQIVNVDGGDKKEDEQCSDQPEEDQDTVAKQMEDPEPEKHTENSNAEQADKIQDSETSEGHGVEVPASLFESIDTSEPSSSAAVNQNTAASHEEASNEGEPPAKKAKIEKEPSDEDFPIVVAEEKPEHEAEGQNESGGIESCVEAILEASKSAETAAPLSEVRIQPGEEKMIPGQTEAIGDGAKEGEKQSSHQPEEENDTVHEDPKPDDHATNTSAEPADQVPELEIPEGRDNKVPAALLQDELMDTSKPSSSAAASRKTARQEEASDKSEPPAKKAKIEIQKPRAETMAVMKKAIEMALLFDDPEEALMKALEKFETDPTFMPRETKKVVVIGFDPVSLRMIRPIENFLDLKTLPHASFSFEAIAEATCDPPVIEGVEIVTEQPIKLSPIEYSGFVLGSKGKEISAMDSAKTSFLFVVSSDSEGLVLGPMPPLPTKKGMMFSKGLETDMVSEEQRRVIRRRLASTATSQLAQYVTKGRCHVIIASHENESGDPTVEDVLEALEATPFNKEILEMLRKNPHVLPNFSFVDQVLPVCEDFFHRATSTLKPKDYKKLFIEVEDSDEGIIVNSLAQIIQRNLKGNPLLKKWRTSKQGQGAALFLHKKKETGDMLQTMKNLFSKLRNKSVGGFAILAAGEKEEKRVSIHLTSTDLQSEDGDKIDQEDAEQFWKTFNNGANFQTGVKSDDDGQNFIFLMLDPLN